MYTDVYNDLANASKNKLNLLEKNFIGYFLASALAGVFVGLGIILIFTIGGSLAGSPYTKILMGISFGIALSLVIMAGSELFTGNNLVMGAGSMKKVVPWKKTIKLWVVCFAGNWAGSIAVASVFLLTGLNDGATGSYIASATLAKTTATIPNLFFRGMLCNTLVCLAVWSSFKMKSESGKLIMIWWTLFAFITSGFEHSIANMTLLTIGLIEPMGLDITMAGYFTNIAIVTLGNMVGAFIFLVIPYYIISKE